MKRKLFFLWAALLFAICAQAREDVTSTYVNDAAITSEANWGGGQSAGGNHSRNGNGYWESWHNTFSLQQTTGALPAGYYELSIQAVNSVLSSTGASLNATSGSTTTTAYIKHSSNGNFGEIAGWLKGSPDLHRISTTIKVEEGETLTMNFKQTNNGQWIVYGQFRLEKLTDEEGEAAMKLQAVIGNDTKWDITGATEDYASCKGNYSRTSFTAGDIMYQTFNNLPEGKYEVSVRAAANLAAWDGQTGTGDGIAQLFINDVTTDIPVIDQKGCTPAQYKLVGNVGTDGVLKVGMKNIKTGGCWYVFQVETIHMLAANGLAKSWENALASAQETALKPMNAASLAALNNAISTYGNATGYNDAQYNEAIEALKAAISNAQPSIHAFEQGNAINELIAGGTNDVTSAITNASCATLDDWTIDNTSTFHVNTWSTEGNSDNTGMTTPFIENWVGKESLLGNATIKHTLIDNLTAGYYQVQILARVYSEAGLNGAAISGGTFNVNDTHIDLGSGTAFTFNGMEGVYNTYKAVVQVAANGSLDISFGINSANFNWLAFKNLNVTYLGTNVSAGTQTLSIEDGDYVQNGQTVKLTFVNSTTTYTLKAGSKATINGTACNLTAIDGGAEFTIPAGLQADQTYTITIPAGVLTSNLGNSTAVSCTVKTPVLFDGMYFLQNENGKFISRGGNYNTEAVLDAYGVAMNIATDNKGVTTFKLVDNEKFLFAPGATGSLFTDYNNQNVGCRQFTLSKNADTYNIFNAYSNVYVSADDRAAVVSADAKGWKFVAPSAHAAAMTSLKNQNAKTAAAAAGLTANNDDELAAAVEASGLTETTIDVALEATNEFFQATGTRKGTISITTPGLYCFSMPAYTRMRDFNGAYNLHVAEAHSPVTYIYFAGAQTQVCSVFDASRSAAGDGLVQPVGATAFYPNSINAGTAMFNDGLYNNTVWVYISEPGDYEYGITNASGAKSNDWTWFGTPSLMMYSSPVDAAKAELGSAINNAPALPTVNISEAAPFKFNKTEVDNAKAIIEEAKALISNASATIEQVEAMKTKVEDIKAISVNEGGYFSLYNVILKYEGWAHNNKLISAYENAGAQGGYSMGYYARGTQPHQNVRLIPNGDGTYALAFNNGTVFVCTGVVYGGNTSQLRATNDSSKALAIKIQPSTTEEGIVTLLNTEANNYIGSQDAGLYTVNSHINFTIALVGDINNDEKVDADDVTALAQVINEEYEGTHGEADINNDGKVSVADVTTLVDIIQPKKATKVVAKVYAEQLTSENASADYAIVSATSMTDNSDVKSTITATDYFTTLNIKTTLTNVASVSVYSVDKKAIAGDMIAIDANGKVSATYAQGEENTYTHARYAQSDVVTVTGSNAGTYTAYLFPVELTNGVIVTVRTTGGSFYSQTFTGINAGKANELTFTETTATNNWMATIPGNTYFSKISTPGAHDACTKGNAFGSSAECQDLTLQELLDAGVRQFDIRPGYFNNTTITAENLYIWHGITKTSTLYVDAIKMLADFVQAHPTEAISVVMVKENNKPVLSSGWTDRSSEMWSVVNACHTTYKDYMKVLDHSYYTLDDFRGKICYINRTGTDVNNTTRISDWPDDATVSDFSCKIGGTCSANVQDKYNSNGTTKQTAVKDMINQSKDDTDRSHFYYNYLSSANSPSNYASSTNPTIASFLGTVSGPTGYLLCDYIGCDKNSGKTLLNAIINQNYKYVYNGRSRK